MYPYQCLNIPRTFSAGLRCCFSVLEVPPIVPENSDRETGLLISHSNDTTVFSCVRTKTGNVNLISTVPRPVFFGELVCPWTPSSSTKFSDRGTGPTMKRISVYLVFKLKNSRVHGRGHCRRRRTPHNAASSTSQPCTASYTTLRLCKHLLRTA